MYPIHKLEVMYPIHKLEVMYPIHKLEVMYPIAGCFHVVEFSYLEFET